MVAKVTLSEVLGSGTGGGCGHGSSRQHDRSGVATSAIQEKKKHGFSPHAVGKQQLVAHDAMKVVVRMLKECRKEVMRLS